MAKGDLLRVNPKKILCAFTGWKRTFLLAKESPRAILHSRGLALNKLQTNYYKLEPESIGQENLCRKRIADDRDSTVRVGDYGDRVRISKNIPAV